MSDSKLNARQQELIHKIISNRDQSALLQDILGHFLSRGLGAVTKKEMETYIFHVLQKTLQSDTGWSNHEWSCLLKVPESKVKSLRVDAAIRFEADDDPFERNLWYQTFYLLCNGEIEKNGEQLVVTIENPVITRFIANKLKSNQTQTLDFSINSERVLLPKQAIKILLKRAEQEHNLSDLPGTLKNKYLRIKAESVAKNALDFFVDIAKDAAPELCLVLFGVA